MDYPNAGIFTASIANAQVPGHGYPLTLAMSKPLMMPNIDHAEREEVRSLVFENIDDLLRKTRILGSNIKYIH